ncbi:proteasome activator complex subunit 3-like [Tropilaelaps mercedesae]|uniref:Proteasome activator complex subunit 3-like n=1 Tax=Tropilaelaps mercedesae TaxID=418985 RepID=A0A1V9XLB5_9ACAR|nr:proteasome activator complex subunit 3-like [Tropilaelaps mercedesae]
MEALYDTAERVSASNSGNNKVKDLKEEMKGEAEALLLHQFPARILQLEQLLQSPEFNIRPAECHAEINVPRPLPITSVDNNGESEEGTSESRPNENGEPESARVCFIQTGEVAGTKILALPGGTVGLNQRIVKLYDVVKPLISQLINDCNLLKMWIQFLIPKVEDGNNFGVGIQEDCLSEVRTVEVEAAASLDQISRYHTARGRMVSKIAKYPHIEDFRKAVDELDEKTLITIRLTITELRNNYSTLHDIITKNLDKIKLPRTSNAQNLY